MSEDHQFKLAASAISKSDALLITAGAGMGVDSGLPDFRGDEGFWNAYPPFRELGLSFVDLADPKWFRTNPRQAWGFYGHRLNLYRDTKPHAGFSLLLKWGQAKKLGHFVFTSNVDGQFQKAGFSDTNVYECHGSFSHIQCSENCTKELWSSEGVVVSVDESTMLAEEDYPRCKNCGACARPNILMFGDLGWVREHAELQDSRYQRWLGKTESSRLAVVEIGAGTSIPSVRRESENRTRADEQSLIRINIRESQSPRSAISVPYGGLEALVAIDGLMQSKLE